MLGENKINLRKDNTHTVLKYVSKSELLAARHRLRRANLDFITNYKKSSLVLSSEDFNKILLTDASKKRLENIYSFKTNNNIEDEELI